MRFKSLVSIAACVAALAAVNVPVAFAQTCTGDCGQDGAVTIDDVIAMVAIAQGTAALSACTAADPNHDNEVTIDEIIAAVSFAQTGCAGQPTIQVGSVSAARGAMATFSVSLATAGQRIEAVQHELRFPADAPIVAAANGDPSCTSTGNLAATFLPAGCAGGPSCNAIRITYARSGIPDGTVLYSCTVRVAATATSGARLPLTCANAKFVNSDLNELTAGCVDGAVTVTP